MDDAVGRKKSWLLRAELVVFVCLACFCVVKPAIVNMDSAKAGVFKKVIDMVSNDADVAPHEKAVVIAIFYNEDNPSAMIAGIGTVYEADTIYEVKIIKIYRDKVEFEKKGRSWTQKVREQPATYWK